MLTFPILLHRIFEITADVFSGTIFWQFICNVIYFASALYQAEMVRALEKVLFSSIYFFFFLLLVFLDFSTHRLEIFFQHTLRGLWNVLDIFVLLFGHNKRHRSYLKY